jgi:hypothetical protein
LSSVSKIGGSDRGAKQPHVGSTDSPSCHREGPADDACDAGTLYRRYARVTVEYGFAVTCVITSGKFNERH